MHRLFHIGWLDWKTFTLAILGSILVYPVVAKLPAIGWDWYYFFNGNSPVGFTLTSPNSAYPPYARYILALLTWMDWRVSLAYLNSITLVAIALGTWKAGGRYGSILLALLSAPVLMVMWIGHPDGLVLLGVICGIAPLALIKPHVSIWAFLSRKAWAIQAGGFLALSLVLWPGWIFKLRNATLVHEAAFGWAVFGWPVLVVGLVLLAGAGKDIYRLMAAGSFLSPYLMPYHLVLLAPALGNARASHKAAIFFASWLVALGTGMGGQMRWLSLLYPLAVYCLTHSVGGYKKEVSSVVQAALSIRGRFRSKNEGSLGDLS